MATRGQLEGQHEPIFATSESTSMADNEAAAGEGVMAEKVAQLASMTGLPNAEAAGFLEIQRALR
eukprot:SAG11_NODE_36865_length_259_cov_1.262500_1_plen_64_part_10